MKNPARSLSATASVRDTVHDFVAERLAPSADQWGRDRRVPREALKELAALGALGMLVPSDWGGAGLDRLTFAVALESMAMGDGSTALMIAAHNTRICHLLQTRGTPAQKSRWLVGAATGALLGCYCFAERLTGQDFPSIGTTARRQGNYWILDGIKQLVTSGTTAQVAVVLARAIGADGEEHGLSWFLVPTDSAGYYARRMSETFGLSASDLAEVRLEGCQVPSDCLLGSTGEGEYLTLSGADDVYLAMAALAVGLSIQATSGCTRCTVEAVSEDRRSQIAAQVQAAYFHVRAAARLTDAGLPSLEAARTAKQLAVLAVGGICSNLCSELKTDSAAAMDRARRDLGALSAREYGLIPMALLQVGDP